MISILYLWNRIVEIDPSTKRKPELPSDSFCSGFINKLVMRKQNRTYGTGADAIQFKHGQCIGNVSRLYAVWTHMIYRCEKPNDPVYKNYGGRGISVCIEWHDPKIFFDWALSHGYDDNLTIDRIENDGNYSPQNCHFITRRENVMKRPKNPDHGIYFRKDKGDRFVVVLYKRIGGRDTAFYGGHYFSTKEQALRVRDELYEQIKNLK